MNTRKFYRTVKPLIAAASVIATSGILVFTIYFTELGFHWVTFLTGILIASILAVVTRASHTEYMVTRRTAQLAAVKSKLEDEIQLRKNAEKQMAAEKSRIALIDEDLPNIVALVDTNLCFQYHNRAFRDWVSLRAEQINGQTMRAILGSMTYGEMENAVRQSLNGKSARYTLMQKMPKGKTHPLSVEHFPQFAQNGRVSGFYISASDVANRAEPIRDAVTPVIAENGESEQDMFIHSFTEKVGGQKDAINRIMAAIEKDEFHLFCQLIAPLSAGAGNARHYEILVRLQGEEDSMMPPGAFFPLAEKHGLMPHLDRWVVQHVAEWISNKKLQGVKHTGSIFFINIANDTISDTEFPVFLQQQLLKYDIPGAALCFEIAGTTAIADIGVAKFAQEVRQCGCQIALSGFGQEGVLFELLQSIKVDFLKIDGSIILHILRDPIYLAKVSAISQVAKKIGVKTVAELVESEEIIKKLRELGIDSAQGFGISPPRPITEIE